MPGSESPLIDMTAASVYLGVTPRHVGRLIASGKLRAWRRNGIRFVAVADLHQFVDRRETYQRKSSYDLAHRQVVKLAGPARNHICNDCDQPAEDWSYDGGARDEQFDENLRLSYSMDPTRYSPRCRTCHQRYDGLVLRPPVSGPKSSQSVMRHLTRKYAQHP